MVSLSNIQGKLNLKVFQGLGSTVTVRGITNSYDVYGDKTTTSTVDTSVSAVPFYTYFSRRTYNPFGQSNEGETDMVLPYTTTIDKGYQVIFDSKTYDVVEIEKYPLQGGNIAFLVRLKEQLS